MNSAPLGRWLRHWSCAIGSCAIGSCAIGSCAIWLAALTGVAAAATDRPLGEIAGRAVDESGRGIGGAKLLVWPPKGRETVAETTAGPDGRFVIHSVPIGRRLVAFIDADGFGREFRDGIDVFPNQATQLGEIRLAPGCICEGRIFAIDGKPAPNVGVVVKAYRYELGHTILDFGNPWHTKSGADGRFLTPPLPSSFAVFSVEVPPGSSMARTEWHNIGPETSRYQVPSIHLVPEVPLEGVVTDKLGQPIADAEVWCSSRAAESVRTDSSGRFVLHGLNAKEIDKTRVGVDAKGFAAYQEMSTTNERPRKIALAHCGYISGRAIDAETGEPVALKRVIVCEVKRDVKGTPRSYGCGEARFTQPQKGHFRIDVSTGGEKHLTLMAAGYHTSEEYVLRFDLIRGAKDVTIKMRRDGSSTGVARQRITGVVRSDGKRAPGVWVSLWRKKDEWDPVNAWVLRGRTVDGTARPWSMDVLTKADGAYVLDVADPGDFYVVARAKQGAPAISGLLSVQAGEQKPCDLELPPTATIRGRVAKVTPELAQRLWIVAFGHGPFRTAVPVDRRGEFVLSDVPPGQIALKVGHEGYLDSDVARLPAPQEVWARLSQPWKRAVVVTVKPGQEIGGVKLSYPAAGPPDRYED